VNALGTAATIQFDEVVFAAPTQLKVLSSLPTLTRDGALVVGKPEVTLDFTGATLSGASNPCLRLGGDNQGVYHLRITGCAGTSVLTDHDGARVAETTVVGAAGSTGILALHPATIGPRNDVSGCATGIVLRNAGANCAVDGNRAHGNGIGIQVDSTDNASVRRNFVYGNASHGIQLTDTKSSSVQLNTVDGNAGSGLDVDNQTRTVVLQDNLLTWNGAYGVAAWPQTTFTSFDHNGYYLNAAGDTFRTPPVSADSVVGQDPLYVSRAAGDFRLRPGSPVIDKGVDVGVDVNGPSAGNFNGTAPDLGASETP
jgi:parallel beta-helix repeat protein